MTSAKNFSTILISSSGCFLIVVLVRRNTQGLSYICVVIKTWIEEKGLKNVSLFFSKKKVSLTLSK